MIRTSRNVEIDRLVMANIEELKKQYKEFTKDAGTENGFWAFARTMIKVQEGLID